MLVSQLARSVLVQRLLHSVHVTIATTLIRPRHFNPVHILTLGFFKIRYIWYSHSRIGLQRYQFCPGFPTKIAYTFLTFHMSRPRHLICFNRPNNIKSTVRINPTKLLSL
jgi:hypothetical protein